MVKDIFVIGVWCWNHLFTTIPNTVLFQMESVVIDAIEEDAIIWDVVNIVIMQLNFR